MNAADRAVLGDALARLPLDDAERDALAARVSPRAAELLRRADRRARTLRDTLQVRVPDDPRLAVAGFAARIAEVVGGEAERRLASAADGALLDALRHRHSMPAAGRGRQALDPVLDQVFAGAVDLVEERLRRSAAGDVLAAGFASSAAPRDVDWASAALEELERQELERQELERQEPELRELQRQGLQRQGLGFAPAGRRDAADRRGKRSFGGSWSLGRLAEAPPSAPGWLWARIRGDVRLRLLAMRRRRAIRTTIASAAAAVLLASGLWWWGADAQTIPGRAPEIVFQSVSSPLTDQFSTTSVMRRLRDGR